MDLPPELLSAVASAGNGKIALIVGAGCSVEDPTGLPVAPVCSKEIHRRLVADGVLQDGDCKDPADLSLLADVVFAKRTSQRDVVSRLREDYNLQSATPNNGYLLAAAMLCEGVISSVVTLNFDLALSHAISELGCECKVKIIESPEQLCTQNTANVYYLHRNVNEKDPDKWVLRTAALKSEWKDNWEPIIAVRVLTAPVVVFAGLGTPVSVLIESTRLLRKALPDSIRFYQVDPAEKSVSQFFKELAIEPAAYLQSTWCQFMDQLSQRLLDEQLYRLQQAVNQKVREDKLPSEDVAHLINSLRVLGLIKLGKLRANWLLQNNRRYIPANTETQSLIADLLLALAMMTRISGALPTITDDGLVEFARDGRKVAVFCIASGCGHRSKSAVGDQVKWRLKNYKGRQILLQGVIISGTSDTCTPTPPTHVALGDLSNDSIMFGSDVLLLYPISDLWGNPDLVRKAVP